MDKPVGNLLYQIATCFKGSNERVNLLVKYVCELKLNSVQQISGNSLLVGVAIVILTVVFLAAFDYFKDHPVDPVNIGEFDEACGVGVVVTREEIVKVTRETLDINRSELLEKRYRFNVGKVIGIVIPIM